MFEDKIAPIVDQVMAQHDPLIAEAEARLCSAFSINGSMADLAIADLASSINSMWEEIAVAAFVAGFDLATNGR